MGAAIGGSLPLAVGVALLLVAARQFLGRPKNDTQADLPSWMAKIDEIKPLSSWRSFAC